jgi:xanthine/uracil permease
MFSPVVIVFAGVFAVFVGFISKFGAVIRSIPQGVLGGISIILYALIAVTGIRIWVVNKVNFEGNSIVCIFDKMR